MNSAVRNLLALGVLAIVLGAPGCTDSGLLDGKGCDSAGRCLDGWVCEPVSNLCLRPWELPDPIPEPIVLHTFEAASLESGSVDEAPRLPDVPLEADPREPVELAFGDGQLVLTGGRLSAGPTASRELVLALLASGSFSVQGWCDPAATVQHGPARIVTLSATHVDDGLGFGQEGNDLIGWVRTEATGPDANVSSLALRDHAFPAGQPRHVLLTFDGPTGLSSLYVDGVLADSSTHTVGEGAEARPARLVWDADTFGLGLGDEADGEHVFRGSIQRFAVWDLALDAEQAAELEARGP